MAGLGRGFYDAGMGGDAAGGGLVVGLLGPVEVGPTGGALALVAQPRLRVLLGLLAVAAGRVLSAGTLVDGVWGEEWSPRREQNLHVLVYQLRRRLAAAEPGVAPGNAGTRLVRAGVGYRLALGPGELDVAVFTDLAGRGRAAARAGDPAQAAGLFGRALGLWRGPALADAAPLCPRLAGEAARLEESRLAVVEERVGCDLAAGRHGEAAGELAGLVAEFPLRERLAVLLMTALYRCGRRGEALAVYDTARRVLAAELGLDPGPELAGLQARVLADDPALAAPVAAAAPAPVTPAAPARAARQDAPGRPAPARAPAAGTAPRQLVERGDFLAQLEALRGEALGGSGRLVFLGGEAGVGKSALAAALAAAAAGHTVRRGCCDNVTTAEPLGPLVDALPELAGVLAGDAGLSKFGLFQHVRNLLSGSPLLVLVEDVHWADEATLDVLRFLGRRLAGSELMILATFRSEEVGRDHPLTVVLGDLATMPGVVRMQLPPLTGTGVRQLLEQASSELDAGEVYLSTGGNPFYVTEVIAAGSGQVPATVRDAVLARVSGLSQPGRDVVAAAAVLGRGSAADLLARVSGQPLAAVDECLHRGVLVADGNAVSFRHELARLAVQHSLPRDQRAQVHAQALAELIARGSGDDRQLAYHAAGCGDRTAVLRHAPVAAARASRLGAHREAAGQLDLALRHYDRPDRRRAGLLAHLSYECHLTGRLDRAQSCQLEAVEIYEREGDALAVGRSQRWLSRLAWMRGQAEDSRRHAAAAIAALEPLEPGRELAMAYSNMAQLRMLAGETAEAVRGGTRAIELARRLSDRETEAHALNNVGTALCMAGDVPDGLARLAQSLDLALANDAHEHVARAYNNLGHTAVANRMFADADRHLRAGIVYCAERDLDTLRLNMVALQVWSLAEQGRYAAADQGLADVLRHPDVSPITRLGPLAFAGALAARRGGDDTAALDEALRLAVHTGEVPDLVPVAVARAEAAWIAGRVHDIVAEVDRVWPAAVASPLPWDLGELSWWLQAADEHRQAPIPLARPFALMLAGEHSAAAEQWRALGCPLWQAYALARSPHTQDAQECLDILDRLGIPAARRAVLRDRHASGLPVPRGPRAASRANPGGLTARELEVLGLLADGLSYAEVAQRLTLSEKTVGHHVSAVLRKLGEPTRSRAVAAAVRRGILTPN
jgi:DNA-binding SARP family transcriptional activator/DNA-binding CsgD family transcriptional regulator/tetratricopeptide (TPR) repeat protein